MLDFFGPWIEQYYIILLALCKVANKTKQTSSTTQKLLSVDCFSF